MTRGPTQAQGLTFSDHAADQIQNENQTTSDLRQTEPTCKYLRLHTDARVDLSCSRWKVCLCCFTLWKNSTDRLELDFRPHSCFCLFSFLTGPPQKNLNNTLTLTLHLKQLLIDRSGHLVQSSGTSSCLCMFKNQSGHCQSIL